MGLTFRTKGIPYEEDFHHSEGACFTYGSFGDFRRRIGTIICLPLYEMEGFGGVRNWDEWRDHPLYPLMNHSDCDGEITWIDCARIFPALEMIISKWPQHDLLRKEGMKLVAHMRYCVEAERALVFN
jgi:hypothetical protein